MAMSSTVRTAGQNAKAFNVIASADADTGNLVIAHGMGVTPAYVFFTPLLAAALLSSWSLLSVDGTNITIVKNTTTGSSGNASAQLAVTALSPHSMIA